MEKQVLPSNWRVLGASVTGTSHMQAGRGCDDAHAYCLHEDNLLCLALADGAGTAAHSAQGAATAVQSALDLAGLLLIGQMEPSQRDQWESILCQILQAAHRSLIQQAQKSLSAQDKLSAFATTLLFVCVTQHWIATVQIGDGAIVIEHSDGTIESLTYPDRHEYINETSFLTDTDYLSQADYTVLPRANIQSIAMLSDGLQMLAMNYPDNTPYQPFFAQMFSFARRPDATEAELQAFLTSERVCARTDDDKTIVLAVSQ